MGTYTAYHAQRRKDRAYFAEGRGSLEDCGRGEVARLKVEIG